MSLPHMAVDASTFSFFLLAAFTLEDYFLVMVHVSKVKRAVEQILLKMTFNHLHHFKTKTIFCIMA